MTIPTLKGQVYIKPEYIDIVNPLVENNEINFKPWTILKHEVERKFDSNAKLTGENIVVYHITREGFVIKVGEHCLMSMEEMREMKLNQIL
jgi:hypothetical protein